MSARVQFDGLAELMAALARLPEDLAADAASVVRSAADDAAAEIIAAYPTVSGDLKGNVKVVKLDAGRYGVAEVVRSTSDHARIYESGSQTRQTALGTANPMPAANTFVPITMRRRRDMVDALIAIVERAGFTVRV